MNGYIGAERIAKQQEQLWHREKSCPGGFGEQEWIDWLLGSVSEPRHTAMAEHLDSCSVCLELKSRWENILGMDLSERKVGQSAISAALPSESIRRSLRSRVKVLGWRSKGRQMLERLELRRRWLASVAATVMLVLIGLGLGMNSVTEPASHWNRYVEVYEPEALPIMTKPDTRSYAIAWGSMQPEGGMLWYNEVSGEMLMLVGGLMPEKNQSIRVWLVKEGSRDSLGLLQYHANRAHLYVKNRMLDANDDLELTIESRGSIPGVEHSQQFILLNLLGR